MLIRDFQSRIRETTQDSEPAERAPQRTSVTPAIARVRNCLDMGLTDPQDDATEWTVVVRRSKRHSRQADATGAQAQPFAASEIHSSSVD